MTKGHPLGESCCQCEGLFQLPSLLNCNNWKDFKQIARFSIGQGNLTARVGTLNIRIIFHIFAISNSTKPPWQFKIHNPGFAIFGNGVGNRRVSIELCIDRNTIVRRPTMMIKLLLILLHRDKIVIVCWAEWHFSGAPNIASNDCFTDQITNISRIHRRQVLANASIEQLVDIQ